MLDGLHPRWIWLGAIALTLLLLHLLAPILTPFVIGAALAYLGDPLVDRLERAGLSRTMGVSMVFLVLFGLALLSGLILVPMVLEQAQTFLRSIPDWLRWVQDTGLPKLGLSLPQGTRLDAEGIKEAITKHWAGVGGVAAAVWARASASGSALLTAVVNLMLVPIVTFYLLRDWDLLIARIGQLIPRSALPTVQRLAQESDGVLAAFIRGQLSVMAALAVFYSIGLTIAGLDLALLIGLLAGLVSFVPYLGFITGIVAASIAIVVQTHDFVPLIWVAIVFGIGQVLESMLLTPLLVGNSIGLHPVTVIFAVLAGGELFGFAGVLLALPAAAVIAVVVRHAVDRWLDSQLYLGPPSAPAAPVDLMQPVVVAVAGEADTPAPPAQS